MLYIHPFDVGLSNLISNISWVLNFIAHKFLREQMIEAQQMTLVQKICNFCINSYNFLLGMVKFFAALIYAVLSLIVGTTLDCLMYTVRLITNTKDMKIEQQRPTALIKVRQGYKKYEWMYIMVLWALLAIFMANILYKKWNGKSKERTKIDGTKKRKNAQVMDQIVTAYMKVVKGSGTEKRVTFEEPPKVSESGDSPTENSKEIIPGPITTKDVDFWSQSSQNSKFPYNAEELLQDTEDEPSQEESDMNHQNDVIPVKEPSHQGENFRKRVVRGHDRETPNSEIESEDLTEEDEQEPETGGNLSREPKNFTQKAQRRKTGIWPGKDRETPNSEIQSDDCAEDVKKSHTGIMTHNESQKGTQKLKSRQILPGDDGGTPNSKIKSDTEDAEKSDIGKLTQKKSQKGSQKLKSRQIWPGDDGEKPFSGIESDELDEEDTLLDESGDRNEFSNIYHSEISHRAESVASQTELEGLIQIDEEDFRLPQNEEDGSLYSDEDLPLTDESRTCSSS